MPVPNEIASISELSDIGWTDEDKQSFTYALERVLSMSLTPEWLNTLLDGGVESVFVSEVLLFFVNRYWIYRRRITLDTVQDSIGYVLASKFSE